MRGDLYERHDTMNEAQTMGRCMKTARGKAEDKNV
jgi:hypothetical protein